jgi:ectoine hydroxylase-related dioxygenase (phytanoyl-CoA dioxygenase family)
MPALTNEQLEHFKEYGYVPVRGVLDPVKTIDPIVAEYHAVLDSLATRLFKEGKISSAYPHLPFGERVTRIYAESKAIHNQHFDFSLPQTGVKNDTPYWAGPAVFGALTAPSLLDAVESIIGPEVYSNPVQHVRIKPPESQAPRDENGNVMFGATPFHQDNGVVTEEADKTFILTVWFPLMDTDEKNGCLQVVPGSHRGKLLDHCPASKNVPKNAGLHIPDTLFNKEDAVPVPLKKGDALFMHKLTIHASLPNLSERIRWSFDLRYNPIGQKTGRGVFPGFVARSRSHPEAELREPKEWNRLWAETRAVLASSDQFAFNRWRADNPVCA